MSDPVTMARVARERLAQALGALQSPGVPAHLLDVAEPVARAMSALHHIETAPASLGALAPQVLAGVRHALSGLQAHAGMHPAVEQAVESVAGSLNLVHQLSTASVAMAPPAAAAARVPYPGHGPAEPAPPTRPSALHATQLAEQHEQQHAPQPPFGNQPGYAAQVYPAPTPQYAQPPAPQFAQPPGGGALLGTTEPSAGNAVMGYAPAAAAPVASGQMKRVSAELGAHSPTNFYKGLSGNDVIDAGGIFISTYQIPPIGQHLVIHVTMPGGYEFEAKGVVRWTREAPESGRGGGSAPPGYGVQFTEISPEGRHLVYRYTRNREPLFHDDL